MIINCKEIRDKIIEDLKKKNLNKTRGVFIQVGNNAASNIYVRNKKKLCEELGIKHTYLKLDESIEEEELLRIIEMLNKVKCVTGVMVQLPLPEHISEGKVINAIDYRKDIDGFTDVNKGKLMIGDKTGIISCTPKGIMTVLEHENIDVKGKNVVIVGRSNIVGKPMAQLLINAGATVIICNSRTNRKVLKQHIINSDIFISAIGQANYFNEKFFYEYEVDDFKNIIAIDVGMNRDENNKLCGDISKDMYYYFKDITPVPGGIGLLTVLEVVRNLIKCSEGNE